MTPTLPPEVRAFADAVRAELADLPDDDVAELLEDVEQHLAEAAADGRLAELGSPAAYAAELRSAAGLPARQSAVLSAGPVLAARRAFDRVRRTRAYAEVRAFAPELRPGWWVARGYLLAVALAFWTHDSLRQVVPVPHVSGNALLGLLVAGAAVVGSVAWGRREATYGRAQRAGVLLANAVAVVAAFAVLQNAGAASFHHYEYVPASYPPTGLYGPYGQVDEIYPYDAEGQPLSGVRLYDRNGNALAPMVCDVHCPRLSFPLTDEPRGPIGPGSEFRMQTPEPTPSPVVTPSAPPSPSAADTTAKPKPSPSPSAKRRR